MTDIIKDILNCIKNNETEMLESEKMASTKIDVENWWKSRNNYELRLSKLFKSFEEILEDFVYLFLGNSSNDELN